MKEAFDGGQMDLFSLQKFNPIESSLCVVLNGQCVDISWRELFDTKKYDILSCVTYVSSASFFAKAVGGFKNVKIIIGIEKGEVKKAFAESMRARIHNDGVKFFESLPDDEKKRLIAGDVSIRYSKSNVIIHSKFYLLSNSETGETRFIFGSANLTDAAFNNTVNQYEDVMVFDNDRNRFSLYSERFAAILNQTVDYVPQEATERYIKGNVVSIADFTPEEMTNSLIDALREHNIVPVCTEAMLEYAQEAQAEAEKEVTEVRSTFEVITVVSKKSKKGNLPILKTDVELANAKTRIVDILFRGTKKENELARFTLSFNEADKKQYILFNSESNDENSRPPECFDRQATDEEIKFSIQNLNAFVLAYRDFVHIADASGQNLSRILEIILYSFMSAYLFKVRQETSGSKADIPIMLVIGGRPASGKSNLLAYLDKLLSGRQLPLDRHYIQYKTIEGKNDIFNLFHTNNTYPLLVDEVAPGFFTSKSSGKGEELIKYLSNTLSERHPVMICTTNTGAFSIPAQVARRIYYLQVDSCFNENMKAQANAYYEKVMDEASNLLFRDFCYRMGEKIRYGESLFNSTDDFLFCAREIFREYYTIAEVPLPEYFPHTTHRDYALRGQHLWRTLFQQEQNSFTYEKKGINGEPVLTIPLKQIVSANKDSSFYMNYLRSDLLVEEAGMYVVLRAEPFLRWIGVQNPWGGGLFQKFFRKKKS